MLLLDILLSGLVLGGMYALISMGLTLQYGVARIMNLAYGEFRLGTSHFYKSTGEDNLEAQRLFRRAIALDPHLAQAYGFLSYAIVLRMLYFDAAQSRSS